MRLSWKAWVVAVLLHTGTVFALEPIRPPQPPPQRPPQIWIDPAQSAEPVRLQDVAIDIRIQGFVASTQVELTFFNPNPRVLEGELVFPLAEGQSITGYALEVGGTLREGVVVEKETARVAYESTVRRGIDPGLAELTQGNVFRTRLYPLRAMTTKRVRIAFDQPLLDTGKSYKYLLPLAFTSPLAHFKVRAEATSGESAPAASGSGALSFERWQGNFVANLDRTDFLPERELAFDVPKPKTPVTVFNVVDREHPEWRRFAAQVQSAPPKSAVNPDTNTAAPRRIALYYDASGSAATRERGRELAFLDTWFARLRDVEVDLVAFRNELDPARRFVVRNGDARELRAAIEALPLDGASAYGALHVDATERPDLVLVLGDGLDNFSTSEPVWQTAGLTPRLVFAHAAQTVDAARLTRWARSNGGQVINLLALDDAAALNQLDRSRWALLATHVLQGECAELAPAAPQPAGATFSLYGRCSPDAKLELRFGDGHGTTLVRTVSLAAGTALDTAHGAFVERLWATARIVDLEQAPQRDRDAIVALSKTYGVVTRDTSMLVLDRIEDYVRFQVEPREPDLLASYRAISGGGRGPAANPDAPAHRNRIADAWKVFRDWHERAHAGLDSMLASSAELEAVRWKHTPALSGERKNIAYAQALSKKAAALQKRWPGDGADQSAQAHWRRDALALMQELDTLRQQRITLAPDSDELMEAPRPPPKRSWWRSRIGQRKVAMAPAADGGVIVEEASPMAMPAPAAQQTAGFINPEATDAVTKSDGASVGIALREWDPQTPYLARLRAAKDPYAAYLDERREQANTPAFFLDCADYFHNEAKDARLALRVLSNLVEIDLENVPLLRVLAYRLEQWNRFDLAVPLFERSLVLRGEEPQSRRDLALALARRENPDRARAITLLWEIADHPWDRRFPDVELIALHELGDVLASAPEAERPALMALADRLGIPAELREPLPVDLRVVLGWDADNVDIDLWVIDPLGEVAIFRNPRTKSGGHLSRDFTRGYGPEVFTIRHPVPGTYIVKTHYFGSSTQKVTGPATVQLEFQTRFARGDGRREAVTRRLDNVDGEIEIGRFTVGAD